MVLLFDYRHFGESEELPRQLFSVNKQLEDWQNAVDFARMVNGVLKKHLMNSLAFLKRHLSLTDAYQLPVTNYQLLNLNPTLESK